MKLLKLILYNFKGIKQFELCADGKSITVFGDNGTGKTTLADAQQWLLFDSDSCGTKSFVPKPKSGAENAHGMETCVEGTYQFETGCTLTLKKTFAEVWKKKRGIAEAVFSGHTKNYYIDGVPVKENEYKNRIAEIAPDYILQSICSSSYYMEEIPVDKRREILLDIIGTYDEQEIIGTNPELAPLTGLLAKSDGTNYTVDQLLKIEKAHLSETNSLLKMMPARIDEAKKAIPELVSYDTAEIEKLTDEKNHLLEQLHTNQDTQIAELQKEIAAVQIELLDAESAFKEQRRKSNGEKEQRLTSLRLQKQKAIENSVLLGTEQIQLECKVNELKALNQKLTSEYKTVYAEQWQYDEICPNCGQPMPESKIEEAQENHRLDKSRRLEAITKKGRETCSKEMIAETEAKLEAAKESYLQTTTEIEALEAEIRMIESELQTAPKFESTGAYREITKKRNALSSEMSRIRQDKSTMHQALQVQIDAINQKLDSALRQKAALEQAEVQKKRVEELESEWQQLAETCEQCQMHIYLCESFVRVKAELLTDRINNKFCNVKFKLFDTQINGGIKEICEALVPSSMGLMPYTYANHAAKVNAGLDIIRVLSEHYGVKMPVFVDNAESIVKLEDSGLQVIRLVVSGQDKKLRVEENQNE